MAWWHWRSPELWLGSGLGLTFQSIDEKRYNTQLGQQIAQSTQSRVASSLHLSTRKDAPIFRGIGAFLQLGGYLPMQEAIPDCQWMSFHFAPRFGGYYELSPHLGLEVAASEDCWDFGPHCFHDFQSERIRVAYGFAIGWTP